MAEAEGADAQPSRRMQKMRQVLEKVLVQSVDSFNFVDMHKCYPTIAKKHGNLLSSFCTDLLQSIRDNVESEFETIAKENQMDQQFKKLERLNDARPKSIKTGKRRIATLASSPNTLLRTHSVRQKQNALKELEEELEKLEARNAAVRKESADKLKAVQAAANELEEIRTAIEEQAAAASEVLK